MIKRFLSFLSPGVWASTIALYGSGRLWREVGLQAARSRWAEVVATIAFLWLLGLLGLSFVLLHLEQNQGLPLPALALAHGLQTSLAIAGADASANFLGRWGLGIVGLAAWVCLVVGSQKLVQLVAEAYGSAPSRPVGWRTRLLPWGVTLLGLGLAELVLTLVGQSTASPHPGLGQRIWWLGRWAIALASLGLGLGLMYRLSPRRWVPGLALWPGVRIALGLALVGLGLRHWGLSWLIHQNIAYGLLLALGLNLGTLYGLILLVPVGALVNVAALRHRGPTRSWGTPLTTPPPPSFDSFKIKRRD
ncbi:hypothetical protein [Nodosilinea nodulosa]|uniref:hypothetical protein n=1 Tax=Nodosilinea nodulosa TaxID=416001 RepID=UPI0012D7B7A3|nr:hypothetical protein [Nodosilinea nodulosa]